MFTCSAGSKWSKNKLEREFQRIPALDNLLGTINIRQNIPVRLADIYQYICMCIECKEINSNAFKFYNGYLTVHNTSLWLVL